MSDSRYEQGELKYIFALHNHPFGSELSPLDLHFIEEKASIHEWETRTRNGNVRLATIAFFSRSKDPAASTCDGFYQYVPSTRELMTWTQTNGKWDRTDYGIVKWIDDRTYRVEKR